MTEENRDGATTLREVFKAARSPDLSATELRLWLVVRSFEWGGRPCFASTDTLAEVLGVSPSTVRQARARLARPDSGPWLQVKQRGPRPPELRAVVPTGEESEELTEDPQGDVLPAVPPKENGRYSYPEDFEAIWEAYPDREGGNPKKAAYRKWRARVNAGVDPAELLEGVKRYARYVEARGMEGGRFVKQAATFFGPDEHWREDYEIQDDPTDNGVTYDRL